MLLRISAEECIPSGITGLTPLGCEALKTFFLLGGIGMKKFAFALLIVFCSIVLVSYPVPAKADKGEIIACLNDMVDDMQTDALILVDAVHEAANKIADILLHYESHQDALETAGSLSVVVAGADDFAEINGLETAASLSVDAAEADAFALVNALQTAGLLSIVAAEAAAFAIVNILEIADLLSVDAAEAIAIASVLFDLLQTAASLSVHGIDVAFDLIVDAVKDTVQTAGLLTAGAIDNAVAIAASVGLDFLESIVPLYRAMLIVHRPTAIGVIFGILSSSYSYGNAWRENRVAYRGAAYRSYGNKCR